MKRPKKRFNSAEEILKEIEETNLRIEELNNHADKVLGVAGFFETDLKDQAVKDKRTAYLLLHTRIPLLSQKLAQIRTPLLPALDDGDHSIPVHD